MIRFSQCVDCLGEGSPNSCYPAREAAAIGMRHTSGLDPELAEISISRIAARVSETIVSLGCSLDRVEIEHQLQQEAQ